MNRPGPERNPVMEDFHARTPVNKTAQRVISPGFRYEPRISPNAGDSRTPLPIKINVDPQAPKLAGHKYARMTVIGFAADRKGVWVVRCSCGTYTYRKTKAILNPENDQDRCAECRHLAYLKRNERWRATGKDQDIRDV